MFEHIKEIQGNVVAIKITGEITAKEHDQLDNLLRASIARYKRIRILLVIKHYTSFNSAEALFEDLRMVKKHAEQIDRMAVVGDRAWKGTWVGLFGLFGGIETDYFGMEQTGTAYEWVTQNS